MGTSRQKLVDDGDGTVGVGGDGSVGGDDRNSLSCCWAT